ncbi:MAG: hypothetical protein ACRCX2_21840, partial [Paraclostridium sp.]
MVKKNWENPEITGLGLQNTKDECTTLDEKGQYIHMCRWCGKVFLTHEAEIAHEPICDKNP